jgi:chromosome segregation ATPase
LADEKRSLEGRLIEVDAQITANSARWRRIVAFLLFRLKALDAELRALKGERQHIEGKMQVIDIDDLRARKNLEAAEVMIGRLDPQLSEVMATVSEKESERNSMEDRLRNLCAS